MSAKLGMALREKHNIGASLKDIILAKKIIRGDELSEDDIAKMKTFFDDRSSSIQTKSDLSGNFQFKTIISKYIIILKF